MQGEFPQEWATNPGLYILAKKENRYNADKVLSQLVLKHLKDKSRILDIGCGPGEIADIIINSGHAIDGLDTSSHMLKRARQEGYSNVMLADVSKPFNPPRKRYDAIISSGVYGDFIEPEKLGHVLPFLKKGGILGICGNASNLNGELDSFVRNHDLTVLKKVTRFGYHLREGNYKLDKKTPPEFNEDGEVFIDLFSMFSELNITGCFQIKIDYKYLIARK